MSAKNQYSLSFDSEGFGFEEFESFVTALLSTDVPLPVRVGKVLFHNLNVVNRYGKKGDKQRGIDIKAIMDGGRIVVFQCKYHDPKAKAGRVTLAQARNAVAKAEEEYPEADHHVFVTNISHNHPETVDFVDLRKNWDFWGGESLHALMRRLPMEIGWHLVNDHFGSTIARNFFPLGPSVLLSVKEYLDKGLGGTFSRSYPCVGRDKEIKKVIELLSGKKPKAVILSGHGGIGKSRLFIEILDQMSKSKLDTKVCIAEPVASGSWEQLSLLPAGRLVIGLDDCHLPERVDRKLLMLARNRPETRLLLMTRPEGMDDLREALRSKGWDDVESIELEQLKRPEMRNLVREIIGKNHEDISKVADLSDGNALFAVIAAELIRGTKFRMRDVNNSTEFREKVFRKFSDEITKGRKDKERILRVTELLALLSPFKVDDLAVAAGILEISEFELEDELAFLEARGLLRRAGGSGRIIPDLFSDFLVSEWAVSKKNGAMRRRLMQSDLFKHDNISIFKNLALAEWCGRSADVSSPSLTYGLWDGFITVFKEADDCERNEMVKNWGRFAMYLPEKTLELWDLIQDLEAKVPDRMSEVFGVEKGFYRKLLLESAYSILLQLGMRQLKWQKEAMDRLWAAEKTRADTQSYKEGRGFSALYSYKESLGLESLASALCWLRELILDGDEWKTVTEGRSEILNWLLQGVFAHVVDRNSWDGRSCQFWTAPVHVENTEKCRELAFEIIEKVASASDFGALNSLELLFQIIMAPRNTMGKTDFTPKFTESWLVIRHRVLGILEKVMGKTSLDLVKFRIRQGLKQKAYEFDEVNDFVERRTALYEKIDFFKEIKRLTAVLSNSRNEFWIPASEGDFEQRHEQQEHLWVQLLDEVAEGLRNDFKSPAEMIGWCEGLFEELNAYGFRPNFHDLLNVLLNKRAHLGKAFRQHVLDKEGSCLAHHYSQFARLIQDITGEERDAALAEGVRIDRPKALHGILNEVEYRKDKSIYPLTREAIAELYRNGSSEELQFLLDLSANVHSEEMLGLIYGNLPWDKLGVEHFEWLGKRFDLYNGGHLITKLPALVYELIFKRLDELPLKTMNLIDALVKYAMKEYPVLAFEFFERRVARSVAENEIYSVFPFVLSEDSLCFGDLSEVENLEDRLEEVLKNSEMETESDGLWSHWLSVIVRKQDNLEEKIVKRRLKRVSSEDELMNYVSYQISLKQVYDMPEIMNDILQNAESHGSRFLERIRDNLFYKAINHGASSTNGVLKETWHLDSALRLSSRYQNNQALFSLYDKIVKEERAEKERYLREYCESRKKEDEFL